MCLEKLINSKYILVSDFNQQGEDRLPSLDAREIILCEPMKGLPGLHGVHGLRREEKRWRWRNSDCPVSYGERVVYGDAFRPRSSMILSDNFDYRSREDTTVVGTGDCDDRYVRTLGDFKCSLGSTSRFFSCVCGNASCAQPQASNSSLLFYRVQGSQSDGSGNAGCNEERPVGPGFWRESFLPNLIRFLIGWAFLVPGGWLIYATGIGCRWQHRRAWAFLGLTLFSIGGLCLFSPVPWRWR